MKDILTITSVQSLLSIFTYILSFDPHKPLRGGPYLHFTEEGSRSQRNYRTCPKSCTVNKSKNEDQRPQDSYETKQQQLQLTQVLATCLALF